MASDSIVVVPLSAEHCEGVEALQNAAYPTLASHEKITASHAKRHLEVFREGQTVAIDTSNSNKVVG